MPHQVVDMGCKLDRQLRIVLGGDEAGYDLKQALIADLQKDPRVRVVSDVGPHSSSDTRAYPHQALEAALMVCICSLLHTKLGCVETLTPRHILPSGFKPQRHSPCTETLRRTQCYLVFDYD